MSYPVFVHFDHEEAGCLYRTGAVDEVSGG